jgi:hypothetical protein
MPEEEMNIKYGIIVKDILKKLPMSQSDIKRYLLFRDCSSMTCDILISQMLSFYLIAKSDDSFCNDELFISDILYVASALTRKVLNDTTGHPFPFLKSYRELFIFEDMITYRRNTKQKTGIIEYATNVIAETNKLKAVLFYREETNKVNNIGIL